MDYDISYLDLDFGLWLDNLYCKLSKSIISLSLCPSSSILRIAHCYTTNWAQETGTSASAIHFVCRFVIDFVNLLYFAFICMLVVRSWPSPSILIKFLNKDRKRHGNWCLQFFSITSWLFPNVKQWKTVTRDIVTQCDNMWHTSVQYISAHVLIVS